MINPHSDFESPRHGRRGSKVRQASAVSIGATVLLLLGYLVATWLGLPLDGLLTPGSETLQPVASHPVTADLKTDSEPANGESSKHSGESAAPATPSADANRAPPAAATFLVDDVTVRNLDGKVVYRGPVDLTETMQRIDAGQRLAFRNDGSTFQNRERRLPIKERGYYKEYVHPTPELGGPGPQRVVTGADGEAYYTFDHYTTFQRIR